MRPEVDQQPPSNRNHRLADIGVDRVRARACVPTGYRLVHAMIAVAAVSATPVVAWATASFSTTQYPTAPNLNPNSIAHGDLDNDGDQDLVTTNAGSNSLLLMRNQAGVFTNAAIVSSFGSPRSVCVANLNGAGRIDMAYVSTNSALYVAMATGAFSSFNTSTLLLPASARQVCAADIDADGDMDLAALLDNPGRIVMFRNNGTGTFVQVATANVSGTPQSFVSVNLNLGAPDFAITKSNGQVGVLFNTTPFSTLPINFTFDPEINVAVGNAPTGIIGADLNGDGYPDLATANAASGSTSVLLNDGPTSSNWPTSVQFARTDFAIGPESPISVTSGDYDCDGDTDLAFGLKSSSIVRIMGNSGTGGFTVDSSWIAGNAPGALTTLNSNGDAPNDIATANNGTNSVTLLQNNAGSTCCHTLLGGIRDNYSTATPTPVLGDPSTESSCPGGSLALYMTNTWPLATRRDFDDRSANTPNDWNRPFGHTFDDLPLGITWAQLVITVRPILPNLLDPQNDSLSLGFDAGSSILTWTRRFSTLLPSNNGVWNAGTVTVDLANLPGGIDLLAKINADRLLDIYVQDDTLVDSITLNLRACGSTPPAGVQPCSMFLLGGPLLTGQTTQFVSLGAGASPGPVVLFSSTSLGFDPSVPGICLGGTTSIVASTVPVSGTATFTTGIFPVILGVPCSTFSFQAVDLATLRYSSTFTEQAFPN